MSFSVVPMEKRVVYDPTSNLDHKPVMYIEKSGNVSTFQPVSTTNFSDSQIVWVVNIPSNTTILDRYMLMRVEFEATIVGPTPLTGNLVQDNQGLFALRSWPLSKCISSSTVTINNQSITAQPLRYMSAFERAKLYEHFTNIDGSSFPSLPDQSQEYSDLTGSSTNPLNNWQSSTYYQQGRGSFPYRTVSYSSAAGVTTQVIRFTVAEPLAFSPMIISPHELENGFIYLNQFNLQIQFGNLSRMLSKSSAGNTFTSVSVSVMPNPTLLVRFITPDITQEIPERIVYPYSDIRVFQTGYGNVTAGSTAQIVSSNIQLQQIPEKIYVYAREDDAVLQSATGYQQADAFAGIQSTSINFNNVSGLLSSATTHDLWKLSARNGMNLKYIDWIGMNPSSAVVLPTAPLPQIAAGSILCIKPYMDFGLPSDLAPGVIGGQYNLQVNLNIINLGSQTKNYTLFIVIVQDGMLTLGKDMSAMLQLGTLSKEDILLSRQYQQYGYHQSHVPWGGSVIGGSFWSDIKKIGQDIYEGAKKAAPYVDKGIDIASKFAPLAPLVLAALGEQPRDFGAPKSGQLKKLKGKKAGAVIGGREITSKDLRRRL